MRHDRINVNALGCRLSLPFCNFTQWIKRYNLFCCFSFAQFQSVDGELRKRTEGKESTEGLPRATMVTLSGGAASYPRKPKPQNRLWNNEALLVDVMSRIGFPLAFVAFNLIYWIYYVYIVVWWGCWQDARFILTMLALSQISTVWQYLKLTTDKHTATNYETQETHLQNRSVNIHIHYLQRAKYCLNTFISCTNIIWSDMLEIDVVFLSSVVVNNMKQKLHPEKKLVVLSSTTEINRYNYVPGLT